MRCKLLILACATAFALSAQAAPNKVTGLEHSVMPQVKELGIKPERGLFVGNSFFYYNNAVGSHVKNLIIAGGDKFSQTTATISGVGLHWHNIKGYHLDKYNVTMMLYATQAEVAKPERNQAALKANCADIRAAGGVPMIMMPWAKQHTLEKTQEIADLAIADANANKIMVAPTGLAFYECAKKHPEIKLLVADVHNHPTPAGTLLEAAVMYSTMFKCSPVGYPYKPIGVGNELDQATVDKIEKIAWETTKAFFQWK